MSKHASRPWRPCYFFDERRIKQKQNLDAFWGEERMSIWPDRCIPECAHAVIDKISWAECTSGEKHPLFRHEHIPIGAARETAPEMLEVLELIARNMNCKITSDERKQLESVIAKAKGD